ncbi:MAG: ABC transporter ATP-binding protein [Bacillota bacterium]
MGQNILINVRNLIKAYGKGKLTVSALDIKGLIIREGEFVAIMGPSGCGKTTLLNLLGALDRPSGGEIYFRGNNIVNLSEVALCKFRREKMGFVFQAHNLIPSLSALKNVQVPAVATGNGCRGRALDLLGLVGLSGKENRLPGELSGGEQQRVAIARAIMMDPELILADEPTGNLDSVSGSMVIELLKKINQGGKTLVVVTHDWNVAKACQRIIRLHDGRAAGEGPVRSAPF